jgi:2C-methyl-D-erythritol 2,4-cyclodiphosphate synthase
MQIETPVFQPLVSRRIRKFIATAVEFKKNRINVWAKTNLSIKRVVYPAGNERLQ